MQSNPYSLKQSERQLAYLQAMGIDCWVKRAQTDSPELAASVAYAGADSTVKSNQPIRLQISNQLSTHKTALFDLAVALNPEMSNDAITKLLAERIPADLAFLEFGGSGIEQLGKGRWRLPDPVNWINSPQAKRDLWQAIMKIRQSLDGDVLEQEKR